MNKLSIMIVFGETLSSSGISRDRSDFGVFVAELVDFLARISHQLGLVAVLRVGLGGEDVVDVGVLGEAGLVGDDGGASAVVGRGNEIDEGAVAVDSRAIVRLAFEVLVGAVRSGDNEENAQNDEEEQASEDNAADSDPLVRGQGRVELDENRVHSDRGDFGLVLGPGNFGEVENAGVGDFYAEKEMLEK